MPAPVDATGLVLMSGEVKKLPEALQSLSFCTRLLCVDSGSSEETVACARQHGADIVFNEWRGIFAQFEFALTLVDTPWLVILDQDEYLCDELRDELMRELADKNDMGGTHGFELPRLSWYYDRFIRHSGWRPDYVLRAFRVQSARIGGTPPHQEWKVDGPVRRLAGDIIHYPYADFSDQARKIDAYTQEAARAMYQAGRRTSLAGAVAHGVARFSKQYILRAGFLDGAAGLILALHGFQYGFQKYLRLLEIQRKDGDGEP
jgi:glycosyltransferase involved in cell wall biosynthesis